MPLKFIAFNANGVRRQPCELSRQLQVLIIDVALLSETHFKPHERVFVSNYHFYRSDRFPGRKGRTAVAVRKGIPHNHADLPLLNSIETTRVCIPTGNSEMLLAAVYKSPGNAWNDAEIAEFLSFRDKTLLAGDLNAKHQFWNAVLSKPSGAKLLNLLHINEFEISALQCPTHYSPARNGNVFDIVVHKNVRLSDVNISNILDSDHLPIVFHLLNHVTTRNY
jgi:exonuclease III